MMNVVGYLVALVFIIFLSSSYTQSSAANSKETRTKKTQTQTQDSELDTNALTIRGRFNCPTGFTRSNTTANSWEAFLQNLPLKPPGTNVKHFDGTLKPNTAAYCAVIDLPFYGNQNYQCADAIMRLRAQYLFEQKKYSEIQFAFVNGTLYNYQSFLGQRTPNASNLWTYLEKVFMYSSTLSLDKQLTPQLVTHLQIGDVFVKGGSPGHAVIVVDRCSNENGDVKFMLAQSYMPAQDLQILVGDDGKTPWYDLNFGDYLYSAEWTFTKEQLKRF